MGQRKSKTLEVSPTDGSPAASHDQSTLHRLFVEPYQSAGRFVPEDIPKPILRAPLGTEYTPRVVLPTVTELMQTVGVDRICTTILPARYDIRSSVTGVFFGDDSLALRKDDYDWCMRDREVSDEERHALDQLLQFKTPRRLEPTSL
jgi:hypothetical protein